MEAYLTEIARFYGVPYGSSKDPAADDDDDEPSAGIAEPADVDPGSSKQEDEQLELAKANTPKKLGPQSPLRVVPPSPSTDNVAPRLKLPGAAAAKIAGKKDEGIKAKKDDGPGGKIPDVNELARRFAELKR